MNKLTEAFTKCIARTDGKEGIEVLKDMGASKEQVEMAEKEIKKEEA